MIKLLIRVSTLASMMMFMSVIANADTVVLYTTQGCFGGVPGGCSPANIFGLTDQSGSGILIYTGQGASNVVVPSGAPFFTSAQLGSFSWTGSPAFTVPPNAVFFTLQITQTAPGGGTGAFQATVTGTVSSTPSSTININFSVTSVVVGGVTYTLSNLGGPGTTTAASLLINPPGQTTSVQSIVTTTEPVPEPATLVLLTTGLAGALGSRRVRRRFTKR